MGYAHISRVTPDCFCLQTFMDDKFIGGGREVFDGADHIVRHWERADKLTGYFQRPPKKSRLSLVGESVIF